jgi:hypothetical protein
MTLRWFGFRVWLVEMLTTVGNNCADKSAKLSGADRANAGSSNKRAQKPAKTGERHDIDERPLTATELLQHMRP